MDTGKLHHHRIGNSLVSCYHVCRHRWWLWIPLMFALQLALFPLEHWLWKDVIGWTP